MKLRLACAAALLWALPSFAAELVCKEVDAEALHTQATLLGISVPYTLWAWRADCRRQHPKAKATGVGIRAPDTLSEPNVGNASFWQCYSALKDGESVCRARCCWIDG